MKLNKKLIAVFLVLTLTFTMIGCSINDKPDPSDAANTGTKVIKSADGNIEIAVPDSWKEAELNNDLAVMELADIPKEQYLLIISEGREDFAEDTSPKDYLEIVIDNIKSIGQNTIASELKELTINGSEASQVEISTEIEKIKIKYLVTVIQSKAQFLQVLAWSLTGSYDENKGTLESVVNSIKVFK